MIEVVLNDRLGKKIRVKCKCAPSSSRAYKFSAFLKTVFKLYTVPIQNQR
jgi:hypothetical protein